MPGRPCNKHNSEDESRSCYKILSKLSNLSFSYFWYLIEIRLKLFQGFIAQRTIPFGVERQHWLGGSIGSTVIAIRTEPLLVKGGRFASFEGGTSRSLKVSIMDMSIRVS